MIKVVTKHFVAALALSAATFASASPAFALQYTAARVTRVEADAGARFMIDVSINSACPANSFLTMTTATAVADKVKNAQSVVLAAFLSGKQVFVYVDDNTCNVRFIHLM